MRRISSLKEVNFGSERYFWRELGGDFLSGEGSGRGGRLSAKLIIPLGIILNILLNRTPKRGPLGIIVLNMS